MSIRITELDAITSLQSGDYIAVDNESTGTHKFDALNIGANIGQNIANTYSSSASYAIGQYCLYDNNLYKCTTTISTPEAWNSSHWIQVTVGEGLYEKVDKVSGKGLSTNDFTNEYKQKLGGIEAGAEVNVQANWAETNTSSDSYIKNKPGNATTSASGFMSASDKQKLDNIEAGAEVNVQPNWAEDDSSKDDYIKNKPTIDTALSASSDNAVRNSAITAGINQVQGNLDTEITNRQNAVSGEQLARENADSALDGRLDTVEETLPNKANINGSYEEMTVGSAEQLISTESIEDSELYIFRASGGGMDIGDRETDKLIGGTIAWNQLMRSTTNTVTTNGITFTKNNDGTVNVSGTATANAVNSIHEVPLFGGHTYLLMGCPSGGGTNLYALYANQTAPQLFDIGSGSIKKQNADTTGAFYIIVYNGQTVNLKFTPQLFDLTQMFGSTIADTLYAMEQAEAGSGVAWFKKYFPKPYYAYDSGSLQSVNVASHDMTGFNQWDEEWEVGVITQGRPSETNNSIRSKNFCPCLPNTTYFMTCGKTDGGSQNKYYLAFIQYDADYKYISTSYNNNGTVTTDEKARYFKICTNTSTVVYGNTYNHDICINRVWTGNRNGEYEPYELHSYTYDESVELRGIPSLVDGELIYDGDTYEADGTVNRCIAEETFNGNNDEFWEIVNDTGDYTYFGITIGDYGSVVDNACVSNIYPQAIINGTTTSVGITVINSVAYNKARVCVRPLNANGMDVVQFKALLALNPLTVQYKLSTPTSEQATGFTNPQVVDAFGTEEYVDAGVKNETRDVSIPVGHVTQYMANLRDKLQHLPNLAKENGDYFVNQTGTQMKLKKVEGYYEDLISGTADNLTTKIRANDQTPYLFRTAGGSVDIGDREYINGIVGGTVAFNQLAKAGERTHSSGVVITADSAQQPIINGTASSSDSSATLSNAGTTTANHIYVAWGHAQNKLNVSGVSSYSLPGVYKATASGNIIAITTNIVSGTTYNNERREGSIIDLTQMFGSTIADYIYSLEQATAGAGVAFFKSLFPKPYYAYNAGELKSVKGLVSHDMVGFNAWDEEWESGEYSITTGAKITGSNGVRCKNLIPIIGGANYNFTCLSKAYANAVGWCWYDANRNYISGDANAIVTLVAPSDARYLSFFVPSSWYGTTYKNDICINLSWDGSRDGEYEPYQKWSYPLDSDLELRGIPKIENGNLYYDGDVYEADGTVTRKYGIVDLGTLSWTLQAKLGIFTATVSNMKNPDPDYQARRTGCVCSKYSASDGTTISETMTDKSWLRAYGAISIRDTSYQDAASFKTAMSGVYLVYELATPTTETADPYTSPQIVNDFGTEEFVISNTVAVPIPVGHNTDYPINLKSKLEMAPDSPDGDGDYIVRQTNGTNEYVPLIIEDQLPAVPSTDGTYTLTVTIASGKATYSWT